jgi:hypothetical protein
MMLYKKFNTLLLLLSLAGTNSVYADVTFDYDNNGNCFPFGSCPVNQTIEYQQFYSHYQFGTAPLEITGISFKPTQGGLGDFDATSLSFTLTLSTTLTRVGSFYGDYATQAPTTSFASNLGTNTVTVFSGNVSLSSSGDDVFDIEIPFTTPYLYDPHAGNLLIGITDISGGIPLRGFAAGSTDLMSRYVNGIYGGTPNIFFEYGYGLATQFSSTANPVPEPFPDNPPPLLVPESSTPAMLLAGLSMLYLTSRRKLLKK